MTATPVAVRGRRSLTSAQRALYASQQRHPRVPLLNMVRLVHVDGPVDPARLARAFASVVAASDVLRTQFRTGPDQGNVVRLSDDAAETEIVPVSRDQARRWAQDRARQVIPLARRAHDSAVLVHEDGTVSWYLAFHHCVIDATSWSLVVRRVEEAYEGGAIELDSYYEWAARVAEPGPARRRAERHWAERSPAPRIGHLYERHLPATTASTRLPLALDPDLGAALAARLDGEFRSVSVDLAWTTALLTATAAYLHRITGATEFALGLPTHNRTRPDARELLGPLVEVFPVDVSVEADDTFLSLHRRVSKALNRTLRFCHPGTAPAATDIEAVVNVIPDAELERFASHPATVERIHSGASDGTHMLRVQLTRHGDLDLTLDLNDSVVAAERRGRVVDHFRNVLRQMAASPEARVAGFALLADEDHRAVEAWGEGPIADGPPTHTADRLRTALEGASHVALVDGERSWRAGELWQRAEEVAGHLAVQGVGPGTRVALEMERSAEAVIAILAVMRAGGSYVPIDPEQPAARRETLIEQAGCVHTLRSLPSPPSCDPGSVPVDASLADEAYLLFTSGSTGEPKGVPISHRGLGAYLAFAEGSYLRGGERPVVPLFSALTFDLTVTSLFLPLLAGGRLVVMRGDGPAAVAGVAAETDITWCKATPSHLELLARLLPDDHSLATLVVGGEAFGVPLAEKLWRRLPSLRIFNEYGPTEAVVGCMIHDAEPGEFPRSADVPIGRPAPGVRLRVVDGDDHLVPVGAAGELLISHPGLTSGYLDGDDTAFSMIDGARWYRSGDLVRMLDDATLVYLRRIDEQLKIGGIRLDPSEIEAALVRHPAVRRAAVRAWSPQHHAARRHCVRCGLADNVPTVVFDADGVCDRCHAYDQVSAQAEQWFKDPEDLAALRDQARARRTGRFDCVALLSGGKDSTYALHQLVEMGFDVHALTLDNGFISDDAKANIRNTVASLGVDHEFATTDAMAAIFRDSLERHSNVCNGCFKTIYTLATNRAEELGAPLVVTGLSRGQLFETRLLPSQFSERRFDPVAIDDAIVAARKAYHRADDAVNRLLDTDVFADDDVFDRIAFVDFYRYVDVDLAEMLRYLDEEAPWVRPADTGRSTNCRINAAGIHTHLIEQGYHNYAEPYAWDVRLGHKRRDEALAELDDRDDPNEVAAMLADVGYRPRSQQLLTAWFEPASATERPSAGELRAHLQTLLPAHAIPGAFVAVDELSMTTNGKLDVESLPDPRRSHRSSPALVVEPASPIERTIVELWERRLGIEPISVDDDFFALGGDSLAALEMTMLLSEELGVDVPDEVAFANATPATLAEAIATLDAPAGAERSVPAAGTGGDPPDLSAGERAMLFEHRLRPGDTRYNQGRLYRVEAEVDPDRLRAAVAAVVARHEPLHWSFADPRIPLSIDEALEFRSGGLASWAEVERAARDVHRTPFDLEHGPLVRAAVYAVGTGETTAIVLATHHISTDESSFERLWSEVEAEYHGEELPALPVSYSDHTSWQRESITTEDTAHWREAVGKVPRLSIPRPDRPEPDGVRERVADIRADELHAAAGTTPFATVLTAIATVLRRYTLSDEVTVGALVSTRDHPLADDLIGYYLNSLPLTIDAEPAQPITSLRARCAETLAGGLAHRREPFAEIVADHRRSDLPDPTPQVLVALQDLHGLEFGGQPVHQEILFTGTAVADATFFVQRRGEAVVLAVEHRGSVVGAAMADQLLADLDDALRAVVRSEGEVGSCRLDSQEQSRLIGPPAGRSEHIVEQVAAHCRTQGDAPAVECGATALSWADLDRWSRAIAEKLSESGVSTGDRVIVALPRSIELVAAIVGTLRAGAAYVPIDPTYPRDRNRAIARAARATAVVPAGAASILDVDGVGVDVPPLAVAEPSGGVALPDPDLDGPAYVIFTSGSTGAPRGVVVGHHQLALSTRAREEAYGAGPSRFLLMSSAAFDSSVAGLFWTLTTGGTLVIPTDDEVHDPDAVVDLFADRSITHTLLVPSLYRGLLGRSADGRRWPDHVVVAGEACGSEVVVEHFERHPRSRLTNEYGPTETTVWSTYAHLGPASVPVPIGTPVAGAWTAVVDHHGELCPGGVVGELVVGGATVNPGYDDGPSASFATESPHGPGPTFHTGDRAAVVDGALRFLGRNDEQLNIGGVRVEPGEIEATLEAFPGIENAVVVARDLRSLDLRLASIAPEQAADAMRRSAGEADPAVALDRALSPQGRVSLVAHVDALDRAVDVDALRRHVDRMLPASSRPAVYEVHDRLPRSANGKLDRAAIRALPVERPRNHGGFEPDRDDGDLRGLVGFYRDALGRDDIGPDDDFFDAGGDSLLALEVLARVERAFGLRPRVAVLLEARTPRALHAALGLDGSSSASTGEDAIVVRPGTVDDPPLWLLPGAGGVPLVFEPMVALLDERTRILGVEYPGTRGERPPFETVEEIGEHCHRVLVAAQPDGPYRLLGYSLGGLVAVDVARRLIGEGREVEFVGAIEAGLPYAEDERGPATKITDALRDGGPRWVAARLRVQIGARIRKAPERLRRQARTWVEHQAIERFGLRPSDRMLFIRMRATGRAAGLRYRPDPVDISVVLFLGNDGTPRRNEAMTRAWARVAERGVRLVVVAGTHDDNAILMDPEQARSMAGAISTALGTDR